MSKDARLIAAILTNAELLRSESTSSKKSTWEVYRKFLKDVRDNEKTPKKKVGIHPPTIEGRDG